MRLTADLKKQIVSSVMADTKKIDYLEQANALVKKKILAASPKVIRDAYAHSLAAFVHTSTYREGCYISFPALFDGARLIVTEDTESAALLKKHSAQKRKREEATSALESLLAGCTTTDMVAAVAPELTKYLPTDAPKKSLPVATGLKDTLVAAGWPKNGRGKS
ncbi:MAG: hypothetical protein WC736_15760 [Gallionella sp.]|jgi:hypothetical protein